MAEAITSILKKEERVFIANHTQAYSLEDIPGIAELANRIKADYPKTLQVYTQGGMGNVRYYTDKLINYHNDGYGMPIRVLSKPALNFVTCKRSMHLNPTLN